MVKRYHIQDYPENSRGNTETKTIAPNFIWLSKIKLSLAKYRISIRLTGKYPQLIEEIYPASIQIIISVIHLYPSNTLFGTCTVSYCWVAIPSYNKIIGFILKNILVFNDTVL